MMFLNDVHKKEEIKALAIKDLRELGIKYRVKKPRHHNAQKTKSRKAFKVALHTLPTQTVTLVSGQQLIVPKLLHELCSFILARVRTEGLFRKGGSRSRQNEIKLLLDAGSHLEDDHQEVDVANVLKTFFRELPEPLFPIAFHDLFLHCILLPKDNLRAILLVCLLLPSENLNTLAYLIQFLNQVAQHSEHNKMDAYNLAVVVVPTLLLIDEKLIPDTTHNRIIRFCEVFKLLIENAPSVGLVPNDIIERIALSCSSASLSDEEAVPTAAKKKKKRRSGSFTRMLHGLKKIVTNRPNEEQQQQEVCGSVLDVVGTPYAARSAKKRKFDGAGISAQKKKDIVTNLPQSSTLSTPFTPKVKDKDRKWSLRSKPKQPKPTDDTSSITSKSSVRPRSIIERRWSQLSHAADFRKSKKRNSCSGNLQSSAEKNLYSIPSDSAETDPEVDDKATVPIDPDYVKIPRTEYEEIKTRVSEIERRISLELENADLISKVETVQCVYEHTLGQSKALSPTTDHLARRLSRELKIRRTSDQKVIRSPSARKIGNLKRRSQEKLNRTRSWHISTPRNNPERPDEELEIVEITPNRTPMRSSSFHGESTGFRSAEEFLESSTNEFDPTEKCRASIVRLRHQNAGMVLEKARLFNKLLDSSDSNSTPRLSPRLKTNKLGASRVQQPYHRVRALKAEERFRNKSNSPRARKSPTGGCGKQQRASRSKGFTGDEGSMSGKENRLKDGVVLGGVSFARGSPLRDVNLKGTPVVTPRAVPNIKKPLGVKSPKRLNRTPNRLERTTPLKVIATLRQEY